tara:strand:- start:72 stop:920 length:849 start_codon:yes stop_codon:yes gene_type:complete
MRPSNRIPGPIGHVGTGSSDRIKRGENDWISINPLDSAQGWTFRQSSQANLVSLTTSSSGLRVQQDITKNASNETRWNHSQMRADRYYAKLRGPNGDLTWSDNFTMEILVSLEAVGSNTNAPDKSGIWIGLSDAEVETGETAVAFAGGCLYFNNYQTNTSSPSAGMLIGGDSNTTSNASATFRKAYLVISPVIDGTDDDGNPQTRQVSIQMLDVNDKLIGSLNSGTQTFEYNADTQGDDPVYIFLAPNFVGANGSNNTDTTFKAWYRISMTDLSPTYSPVTG